MTASSAAKCESPYPRWICGDCGNKYGRGWPKGHTATFHSDTCDLCGRLAVVTEPRDYGHLKPGWQSAPPTPPPGDQKR